MESFEKNYENAVVQENLQINPSIISFLNETRKWAMFLAILGFIGLFFMVGAGLFFSVIMSSFGNLLGDQMPMGYSFGGFMGFFYIAMAVLYFFPIFYTYKFAVSTKKALDTQDNLALTSAFENLKSLFKFMGIITIVIISIYIMALVAIVIVGVGAATMF